MCGLNIIGWLVVREGLWNLGILNRPVARTMQKTDPRHLDRERDLSAKKNHLAHTKNGEAPAQF